MAGNFGSRDDANFQATVWNTKLEAVGAHYRFFNIGTDALPQHMFVIGNTSTVPATGSAAYGKGCVYIAQTGTGFSGRLAINEGTGTSCSFDTL